MQALAWLQEKIIWESVVAEGPSLFLENDRSKLPFNNMAYSHVRQYVSGLTSLSIISLCDWKFNYCLNRISFPPCRSWKLEFRHFWIVFFFSLKYWNYYEDLLVCTPLGSAQFWTADKSFFHSQVPEVQRPCAAGAKKYQTKYHPCAHRWPRCGARWEKNLTCYFISSHAFQ